MEESLKNSLDDLLIEIEALDDVKSLKEASLKVIEKYKTKSQMKEKKGDVLVQEFLNSYEEVSNLSILISDIFTNELKI